MDWSEIIDLVTALATFGGLIYLARQVNVAHKQTKGQFLLSLDDRLNKYDHVHRKIRGEHSDHHWDPDKDEDTGWLDVWSYMGIFERIKVMIDDGIIDLRTVDKLYGYRLYWLLQNPHVYEYLMGDAESYHGFTALCNDIARMKKRDGPDEADMEFIQLANRLPGALTE